MDENKDELRSGYTGEYGNSVDGDYNQSQSTYSYSYKNGENSSTHSGDYYRQQDTAQNAGTTTENQQNNSEKQEGYQKAQDTGFYENSSQNAYQQTNGYGQNPYGQNPYGQNGYSANNGYQNPSGAGNNTPKKPLSTGKKVLITIGCAVLFGLVAGVCFNGVSYISEKVLGIGSSNQQQIEKTTVGSTTGTGNVATGSATGVSDVSAITEQCMPAVVAITSTTKGADYYDLFGQYYQGQDSTSAGTGFIVGQNKKELLIATNNHVIDGAKTISVQFIDGEIYEATEKGADSTNDLAVVAVKVSSIKKSTMNKIKIADLGDSKNAKVGEMVIAIGNALGYGQSVTVGYISAKDREITESSESGNSTNKIKAIQTDAAINPGNSGGALINMQGQVIGINSAKIADSSVEGVGYAIPISVATPIIDELMNRESISDKDKGYLGISGTTVTQEASAYNVPYGVYVKEVAKGGAADKGGIKANDVITAVNKMEVTTIESLQEKVNSYKKGTKVEITLQRSNNGKYQEKKVEVTLQGSESLNKLSDGTTGSQDQNSSNGNNESNGNNNNGSSNGDNGYSNGNGNNTNPYGNNDGENNDSSQGNNGSSGGSLWDQFFN